MSEPEQTTIDVDPPPFTIDPPPFPVAIPAVVSPTPSDIEALKQWLIMQRASLTERVAEIEALLGFIATADDLTVRVARLEQFTGI